MFERGGKAISKVIWDVWGFQWFLWWLNYGVEIPGAQERSECQRSELICAECHVGLFQGALAEIPHNWEKLYTTKYVSDEDNIPPTTV